ncbi:hypothetical protein CY35_01G109100 [Sphagnum magellanicum]|nr:hypothetical protein CY35_01G109100 [Sphagnum magellanicum]
MQATEPSAVHDGGVSSESRSGMHRAPSVDDLFAPMFRLDVQSSENRLNNNAREGVTTAPRGGGGGGAGAVLGGGGGDGSGSSSGSVAVSKSSVPGFGVAALKEGSDQGGAIGTRHSAVAASAASGDLAVSGSTAILRTGGREPEIRTAPSSREGVLFPSRWSVAAEKSKNAISTERSTEAVGRTLAAAADTRSSAAAVAHVSKVDSGSISADISPPNSLSGVVPESPKRHDSHAMGSGMGVGTNSSSGKGNSDTGGHFNSESDDEQLVVDERKQKRMLSNRESARRSRLRKQQHLDELRAHVAHLRAENTHMLNRFSLASQQYAQLSNENRVLQSHVVDLTQRLQRLQQTTEAHHPGAASHLDQAPLHLSLRSGGCEDEAWQQPLITP